jgi:hypothetical protein
MMSSLTTEEYPEDYFERGNLAPAQDDAQPPIVYNTTYERLRFSSTCLSLFNISKTNAICLVPIALTFSETEAFCAKHNMSLLRVDCESKKRQIFSEAERIFSSGNGTVIWINGKWSHDNATWELFPSQHKFFLSKIVESPMKRFVGRDEFCLTVQSFYDGKYEIAGIRCKNKCYFFCELI